MTFIPSIPDSGQSLGASRPQIVNNFASLRDTISNGSGAGGKPNHTDVNSAGAGKHVFVEMPVQTPSAANLTLTNEFGLIAQTSAGSSELFFNRDGVNTAGTPTYIQLTKGIPVIGTNGSTFLPGGIIMKWFSYTQTSSSNTITFAAAGVGNFPNNAFGAVQGTQNTGFTMGYTGLTTSQVTILMNPSSGPGILGFIIILGN